ncbi:DivIVA domain-containing protein [Cellulosilyticum ruminicola]|uniref:DivIVA domain-containing protein n=1 Tax=Cellulosilyticum ruminicola TaxID=425254 RepID=UPI0006D00E81|nr:DivIVA domain-containing protein [Cellulosilyticum ruminicola]
MLSPVDIQNKEFKKSKLGGYNVDEVNEFLDLILQSYQELINENYTLKDKVNVLNESVQYYRTMESTIQNVLVLADKTAQETKANAYEKAEQMKHDAEIRADKMTTLAEERVARILEQGKQEAFELSQKGDDLRRQYLAYKGQFKQLLQAQMELLEQGDTQMSPLNEEMLKAFDHIEDEPEEFKSIEGEEKDQYYTKEYVPVTEEELA